MYALGFDNPWIVAFDRGRRRAPAWLMAALGSIIPVLTVWGGGLAARTLVRVWSPASALVDGLWRTGGVYLVVFGVLLAIGVGLRSGFEGRPRPAGWSAVRAAPVGAALGAVGFCAVVAMLAALGALKPGVGAPTGASAVPTMLAGLAVIGLQAGAEEVFFRGWLQPGLCARWGPWAGLAVSAVVFAAAHLARASWGWLACVNLVLGGLFFGVLALRTGGLWAPFGAHLAWNWLESAGFGLEPNPGLGPFGAVVDLEALGPALLTGAGDGLDGSLASTAVLAVLTLGLSLAGGRAARVSRSGTP